MRQFSSHRHVARIAFAGLFVIGCMFIIQKLINTISSDPELSSTEVSILDEQQTSRPLNPALAAISWATGGTYMEVKPGETASAIDMSTDESLLSPAKIIHVADSLKSGQTSSYSALVDGSFTQINFFLNSFSGSHQLTVIDPDGNHLQPITNSQVNYTRLSNAERYQISDPPIGIWNIEIRGNGAYKYAASGDSSLIINSYFSDQSTLIVEFSEPISLQSAKVVFANHSLYGRLNLYPVSDDNLQFRVSMPSLPEKDIYIEIFGTTHSGISFQRTSGEPLR